MSSRNRSAFTVVEMLVVIAIIGVLAAILLPAVMNSREAARKTQCANNIAQIAKAQIVYATNKGFLAPARQYTKWGIANKKDDVYFGWVHPILTELGEPALAQKFALDEQTPRDIRLDYDINGNAVGPFKMRMAILVCPTDITTTDGAVLESPLSYGANTGRADALISATNNGCMNPQSTQPIDWTFNGVFEEVLQSPITMNQMTPPVPCRPVKVSLSDISNGDGTTNTLMYAESLDTLTWTIVDTEVEIGLNWAALPTQAAWTGPGPPSNSALDTSSISSAYLPLINNRYAGTRSEAVLHTMHDDGVGLQPSSKHSARGFNAAFCDGSVRFVREDIDYSVYALLMTSKGRKAQAPNTAASTTASPLWQNAKLNGTDF